MTQVKALPSFRLQVQFADGSEGVVDMASFLKKECGVFKVLRNAEVFNTVCVEQGAVTWPEALDLAPDKMYDELQKAKLYVMR